VLLLFGLALILNANTSAAATVTTDTVAPTVSSVNPVNNSIISKSQTVKVNFTESIKVGNQSSIILKNTNGTIIKTNISSNNRTLSIIPTTSLTMGKYNLILKIGSIKDLAGNTNPYYSTYFTVSPITLAQMKDGISRAQTFYNTYNRLPNYVSYNTTNIPIAQFQQIIATQGLKINTTAAGAPTTEVNGLTLAQLKDGLSRVQSFYNQNGRLPNYVTFGTTQIPIATFQQDIATAGLKLNTTTTKTYTSDHYTATVSSTTVSASGWNSCSTGWYKTSATFINYCPFCHTYCALVWNPKGTYEGEWTCSKCDADFCICGRCKSSGSSIYLTKA
jgi:hypothetical protein